MEVFSSWWGGTKTPQTDEVGKTTEKDDETNADASTEEVVISSSSEAVEQEQTEQDQTVEQPSKDNEVDNKENTDDKPPTNAVDSAKDWGSYLYNFAKEGTKVVTNTATKTASILQKTVQDKTFMGDFNKEQERFMKEKHSKRSEAAVAPWVGYNEEEQMKEHILALSKDKRNFLRNPPAGVQFYFDFDTSFPVAMAMLQEDPNLTKMRFELVPKSVSEEHFWRNYFYRVSLIKQSSQLTSLASAKASNGENGKQDGTIKDDSTTESSKIESTPPIAIEIKANETEEDSLADLPPDSPPANEFVSDAFSSVVDQADLQKGMEQLGMTDKEEPSPAGDVEEEVPEWEKELQQELEDFEVVDEAEGDVNDEWEDEINQMLEAEVEADQHKN
ncbi:synapse-associated protein 1-like isoform X2 [Antedon mediterranea]|uniref:synapse-associated protein 1-like isoform X2 n=1 Tax=Antedon mediterranea TaxID=105859 RepID=UPI003AF96AEB